MSETIDDLTVEYEEDGEVLVQEVDKEVLSRGAWTTILFRYRDLDRNTGEFGPDKFTIRRYQKSRGEFRQKSKFNISSRDQARKIIEALSRWVREDES